MKFNFSNNLGFTLVELLVVIAIIGILSSVAVVNLNSARDKARTAAVEQTLNSLLPVAFLCLNDNDALLVNNIGPPTSCNNDAAPDVPNEPMCISTSVTWPDIAGEYSGWSWGFCDSDATAHTFSYSANNITLGITIICTETGCEKH